MPLQKPARSCRAYRRFCRQSSATRLRIARTTGVYLVFFTLLATEHVFEHRYAAAILGFDDVNLIDLNWYVFAGIIVGCAFTYLTFARRKWRYKTMTAIGFALAAVYLACFYFMIDYGVEKEALFVPLFFREAALSANLYGMTQLRALVVSMKEIYGWLLIVVLLSLLLIALTYSPVRPTPSSPNGAPSAAPSATSSAPV